MKTQKEIEEKLIILGEQGSDGENPKQRDIQIQVNMLCWILDKKEEFDIT